MVRKLLTCLIFVSTCDQVALIDAKFRFLRILRDLLFAFGSTFGFLITQGILSFIHSNISGDFKSNLLKACESELAQLTRHYLSNFECDKLAANFGEASRKLS